MDDQISRKNYVLSVLDQKYVDEEVHTLLEDSNLFDEKFLDDNNQLTWMSKSFDLKSLKKAQGHNVSTKNTLLTHNASINNPNSNECFGVAKPRQIDRESLKFIEKYRNNTFVAQIPEMPKRESTGAGIESLCQAVRRYKAVTELIERQIKQRENVFYKLIKTFEKYFVQNYSYIIQKAQDGEFTHSIITRYSEAATIDLQTFIQALFDGLCLFYRFDLLESRRRSNSLFGRDNLLAFLTNIVFTEKITKIIFELYKFEEAPSEKLYQKSLSEFEAINPEVFGTPEEFCLDQKTMDYFVAEGMLQEAAKDQSLGAFSLHGMSSLRKTPALLTMSTKSTLVDQSPKSKPEVEGAELPASKVGRTRMPYEDSILMLRNLNHRRSPIHKLKTIVKVAELMSKSIDKYYEEFGLVNRKKLDADQTLSIFLYIVAKSDLKHLLAHCRIIERFSTSNVLNSVSGYYATTLEVCISCITKMNSKALNSSTHPKVSLELGYQ